MTDTAAARYAGARIHRVEDARLLTGAGTFVDDISRPGMLHACFVRSQVARARVLGIDTSEALALPGVHAVFTAADLNPDVKEQWYTLQGPDAADTPRPPLADGDARFVGDPLALVVADSRYIAEDAVDLVVVDYEPLPPLADYLDAASHDELVHESYPGNIAMEVALAPPTRSTTCSAPLPTSSARRSTSRPTPRCRWRRAGSWWRGRPPATS